MENRTDTGRNVKLFDVEEDLFQEPETWTIISALNWVLNLAKNSKQSEKFWESCKNPMAYLHHELGLTNMQIVVLAIMVELGEAISWKRLGSYLGCSRLSMMVYSEEIEELVAKRWCVRKGVREIGGSGEGFSLVRGVVTALRYNKAFVPEKLDGLTEQQFVDMLESHVDKNMNSREAMFSDDEEWMLQLVKANPHLPLCHEILRFDDIHIQSLLLLIVFDYAQWEGTGDEGLTMQSINELYPEEYKCNGLRHKLRNGSHPLIQQGYIEYKCVNGQVNNEQYILTRNAKEHLLSAYTPSHTKCMCYQNNTRFLKSHTVIKEKPLFFNTSEQEQIERLTSLLSTENLPSIQQRLEEQGMRKGFACLFYGTPGTGKRLKATVAQSS